MGAVQDSAALQAFATLDLEAIQVRARALGLVAEFHEVREQRLLVVDVKGIGSGITLFESGRVLINAMAHDSAAELVLTATEVALVALKLGLGGAR